MNLILSHFVSFLRVEVAEAGSPAATGLEWGHEDGAQFPVKRVVNILKKHYGEPRLDVDNLDSEAAACVPTVWYYEKFSKRPKAD